MRLSILVVLVLISTSLFSQVRFVFSNDVYVVLDNGANFVLDNPASAALTGFGNGRIISEDELNYVKWNIGDNIGNYRVPFWNTNGTPGNITDDADLRMYLNITAGNGGSSDGSVLFSTYNTANNNTPVPTVPALVTDLDMDGIPGDEDLLLVDRFYILDVSSYTNTPTPNFHLTWDDDEWGGGNTINETTIKAQRWNSNANRWDDQVPLGTTQAGTNRVLSITPGLGQFFRNWVLVGEDVPLPIELVDFGSICDDQRIKIYWTTASESHNDYFSVFKSKDGFSWELVQKVAGAGNSNNPLTYEIWDVQPLAGNSYYKLTQTDFNGTEKTFGPVNNVCGDFLFEIISVVTDYNTSGGDLEINVSAGSDEIFDIQLLDLSGKVVVSLPRQKLYSGMNRLVLNKRNLGMGAYILHLQSDAHLLTSKVVLN